MCSSWLNTKVQPSCYVRSSQSLATGMPLSMVEAGSNHGEGSLIVFGQSAGCDSPRLTPDVSPPSVGCLQALASVSPPEVKKVENMVEEVKQPPPPRPKTETIEVSACFTSRFTSRDDLLVGLPVRV